MQEIQKHIYILKSWWTFTMKIFSLFNLSIFHHLANLSIAQTSASQGCVLICQSTVFGKSSLQRTCFTSKVSSCFYQSFGLFLSSYLKQHRKKGRPKNGAWQKVIVDMIPVRTEKGTDWPEHSKRLQSIWWVWELPSVPHGGAELDTHMSFQMFFLLLPLLLRHPCC